MKRKQNSLFGATALAAILLAGCASSRPPSDAIDPTTQPSGVTITSPDFETLWEAADRVSRDLLFKPAREDRRGGLYRTEPLVSAQWFEPWRRETRTLDDRAQSSLATLRRTISVQITRDEAGQFIATPSVIVERLALSERRITSSAAYRGMFADRRRGVYGTVETDAGIELPDSYWYPIGNDPTLERYVAKEIARRVKG